MQAQLVNTCKYWCGRQQRESYQCKMARVLCDFHSDGAQCALRSCGRIASTCWCWRRSLQLYRREAKRTRILALREPLRDASLVKSVSARQFHHRASRLELCETNSALRRTTIPRKSAWEPVDDTPLSSVPLRQLFVQLAKCLKVLRAQVSVHDLDNFVLEQPTWQAHVVVAIYIYWPPTSRRRLSRNEAARQHRPGGWEPCRSSS
jgi:hypothetical protein